MKNMLLIVFTGFLITMSPINTDTDKDKQNTIRTLAAGQKYPGSNEANYSGAAVRTSDGSDLVEIQNYSAQHGVIIKGEEGNTTDAKMTAKAKDKTIVLARLVQEEWNGIYLRITEAWDTNIEHSSASLHYEGRALDLTTSDKDKGKLARLAGLAVKAGFNWVYNEGDHVHASVKK